MSKNETIAVSSQTLDGLSATLDPRFGRCRAFTIVRVENNKIIDVRALENPAMMAGGGAGIQAAQLVGNSGAQVVITGNVGPNASSALQGLGLAVYLSPSGTVESVVNEYIKGNLNQVTAATVPSHFGMGRGGGGGRGGGRGMGRGGGGGGGRGMGGGGGGRGRW